MIHSIIYITISLSLILNGCWAAPCTPSYSKCDCYKGSGGKLLRIDCSHLGNITRLSLLSHTGEQEGLTQVSQMVIQGKLLENGSSTTIWSQLPAHAFKDIRVSSLNFFLVLCCSTCFLAACRFWQSMQYRISLTHSSLRLLLICCLY